MKQTLGETIAWADVNANRGATETIRAHAGSAAEFLRELKAIREAKGMPEPVAWMQSDHLHKLQAKHCGSQSMLARCSDHQLMADYKPLYGPELRAHAHNLTAENAAFIHDLEMLSTGGRQITFADKLAELRERATPGPLTIHGTCHLHSAMVKGPHNVVTDDMLAWDADLYTHLANHAAEIEALVRAAQYFATEYRIAEDAGELDHWPEKEVAACCAVSDALDALHK